MVKEVGEKRKMDLDFVRDLEYTLQYRGGANYELIIS